MFYLSIVESDQFLKIQADDFPSSSVIDLQIMHEDLTILKIVILFYVLNSEQVFIFLDFTRNS